MAAIDLRVGATAGAFGAQGSRESAIAVASRRTRGRDVEVLAPAGIGDPRDTGNGHVGAHGPPGLLCPVRGRAVADRQTGFVDGRIESLPLDAQGVRLVHGIAGEEKCSLELMREMLRKLDDATSADRCRADGCRCAGRGSDAAARRQVGGTPHSLRRSNGVSCHDVPVRCSIAVVATRQGLA